MVSSLQPVSTSLGTNTSEMKDRYLSLGVSMMFESAIARISSSSFRKDEVHSFCKLLTAYQTKVEIFLFYSSVYMSWTSYAISVSESIEYRDVVLSEYLFQTDISSPLITTKRPSHVSPTTPNLYTQLLLETDKYQSTAASSQVETASFFLDLIGIVYNHSPLSSWIHDCIRFFAPLSVRKMMSIYLHPEAEVLDPSSPMKFEVVKMSICVNDGLIQFSCPDISSKSYLVLGSVAIWSTIVPSSSLVNFKSDFSDLSYFIGFSNFGEFSSDSKDLAKIISVDICNCSLSFNYIQQHLDLVKSKIDIQFRKLIFDIHKDTLNLFQVYHY